MKRIPVVVRRRIPRASLGAAVCLIALLSSQWGTAMASEPPDPLPGTPNTEDMAQAIIQTCWTGDNGTGSEANMQFQEDCNVLVGGIFEDEENAANAFVQLTADQIAAENAAAVRHSRANIAIISSRLQQVRIAGAAGAFERPAAIAANDLFANQTGGGASGDTDLGRLGSFFQLAYATGSEDQTVDQAGFDFDGWGLTAGLDYRFTDELTAGVALNYSDASADYDQDRGDLSADRWGVTLYGSYYLDSGLFVDGLLGAGKIDHTLKRRVVYSVSGKDANQIAKSSPESDLLSASLGLGYTLNREAWTLTPVARVDYFRNKVDDYQERMSDATGVGGAMAMSIEAETFKSLTSNIGFQLARAISYRKGVVVPQLRLEWVHEFENDQAAIGARFVNDINSTPFVIQTNKPDRDYFDLGIGVSTQFAGGRSAYLLYETLLGYENVDYHGIRAGMRFEFD